MSLTDSHELKKLKARNQKLEAEISIEEVEVETAQHRLLAKKKQQSTILKRIAELETDKIRISDHAIAQYLLLEAERGIESVSSEMLPEDLIETILMVGSGTFPIKNGRKIIVRNYEVVTVK